MQEQKESNFSFMDKQKERIQDRIKQLFKDRSMRQVATDWHMPYSTLNNYFTKGTEPAISAIKNISKIEKVSIEWLINGKSESALAHQHETEPEKENIENDKAAVIWINAFNSLTVEERERLINQISRLGSKSLFYDEATVAATKLAQIILDLPSDDRKEIFTLIENKKWGSILDRMEEKKLA